EGLLDLAEVARIESFDPETPELGIVQEPVVETAQAVFAGVVESGASLEVDLSGTGLSQPDWTLSVRATARPDPEPAQGEKSALAVLDLAFLSTEPASLPAVKPGAGLDRQAPFGAPSHPSSAI